MINYDKDEIKNNLDVEQIFELLEEWGGEPEYTDFGLTSLTICHNPKGEDGSRKLYYYDNSKLFQCWTSCGGFDIFELVLKVVDLQWGKSIGLNEAIRWIASRFGISGEYIEADELETLEDWEILANYNKLNSISIQDNNIFLEKYDDTILDRFNYKVKLEPWLKEGITQEVLDKARIGYYSGGDQITIPHYDIDNRFIGLRGRTLCKEEAEKFGKYRPLKINNILYNHPLGFNLYNLNNSKDNIRLMEKAIIFESEKSTLQYQSYFGIENDISTACCGSNVSLYQVNSLIVAGAKEIIIAFDRQFQEIGDDEYKRLIAKFYKINSRYKNFINISFIFDKNKLTAYKASPTDEGKEKFLKLFKNRVFI